MTLNYKWIAKLMLIIDYYINETNQDKNILFGSEDMCIADQMLDNNYDSLDTNNFLYMYHDEDISGMKGLPVQQDGINRGVYSLWHLLVASHEDIIIIDLNPKDFETNFCYIQFACSFSNFVSKVNLIRFPRHSKYLIF